MNRFFVFSAVLTANCLSAQDAAEISGVVRESSQMPVAGARITVINQATRSETIYYTDKDGFYRAVSLEPQYYTVEAFRLGFQAVVRRDLNVRPGTRLRLDLETPSAIRRLASTGSRHSRISVLECVDSRSGLASHHRAWPQGPSEAVGGGRVGR